MSTSKDDGSLEPLQLTLTGLDGAFSASLTVTTPQPHENRSSSHRLGEWIQAGTLESRTDLSARGAASRPQCT